MGRSDALVFLAGLFSGGAIDHVILAVLGQSVTPYGVSVGVAGNWGLAALDGAFTVTLDRTATQTPGPSVVRHCPPLAMR